MPGPAAIETGVHQTHWERYQQIKVDTALAPLSPTARDGVHHVLTVMRETIAAGAMKMGVSVLDRREIKAIAKDVPRVKKLGQQVFDSLRPFKKQDETWEQALEGVWTEVRRDLKKDPERKEALEVAMEEARLILSLRNRQPDTAFDLKRAVGWEMMRGKDPRFDGQNPYLVLLDLFALNPARVSLTDPQLVVDLPLLVPGSSEMAYETLRFPDTNRNGGKNETEQFVAELHDLAERRQPRPGKRR